MKLTKKELNFLINASSTDETRKHMYQIQFEPDRAVATNGFLLSLILHSDDCEVTTFGVSRDFARRVHSKMGPKSEATFGLYATGSAVADVDSEFLLCSPAVTDQFPNYRSVIPEHAKEKADWFSVNGDWLKYAGSIASVSKSRVVSVRYFGKFMPVAFAGRSISGRTYLSILMPVRDDDLTEDAITLARRGAQ